MIVSFCFMSDNALLIRVISMYLISIYSIKGATHGARAPFYQPRALSFKPRKSCSSPLLVLWQVEMGEVEGVPPAWHPEAQEQRSSHLLRVLHTSEAFNFKSMFLIPTSLCSAIPDPIFNLDWGDLWLFGEMCLRFHGPAAEPSSLTISGRQALAALKLSQVSCVCMWKQLLWNSSCSYIMAVLPTAG